MIRTLSMIVLAATAVLGVSSPAHACPAASHTFKTVALNADGTVTRSVMVRKDPDGQNTTANPAKFVSVVRDTLTLVHGDEVTLNAAPTTVDATFLVKIRIQDQERDEKGVISTTYHVIESSSGGFAGPQKALESAYLVNVKGNYVGNGTYSRGCGEVIKTDLDLESSGDVRGPEHHSDVLHY